MIKNKEDPRELNSLFEKYKSIMRTHHESVPFKEPILILIRRNKKIDFIEDVPETIHKYEHSDGSKRYILLDTRDILTFPYGGKEFRGYICHEDSPLPLPTDAIITTETMNMIIEKTLNTMKDLEAKIEEAKGNKYYNVLIGIAVIIAVIAVGWLMAGDTISKALTTPETTVQPIVTGGKVIIDNITLNPIG